MVVPVATVMPSIVKLGIQVVTSIVELDLLVMNRVVGLFKPVVVSIKVLVM